MKTTHITSEEKQFRESHPIWMARNTGRWGFEIIGDCADLRHDDYQSSGAATRARNRKARLAFGPSGYATHTEGIHP